MFRTIKVKVNEVNMLRAKEVKANEVNMSMANEVNWLMASNTMVKTEKDFVHEIVWFTIFSVVCHFKHECSDFTEGNVCR